MILAPSGTGHALFDLKRAGSDYVAPPAALSAVVFRGSVQTSIVPVIAQGPGGVVAVSFEVPANWSGYDAAFVRLTVDAGDGTGTVSCTRPAGSVEALEATLDRVADILEADQVIENGHLVFRLSGTTTVLMRKRIEGSTCADNVSLTDAP